jgi:hypothetical protein
MTLSIITQIRNESKRLKEWVKFHYDFYDVDKFLFYLDQPEDNTEDVLEELKKEYNIEYLNTKPIGDYQGNNCSLATERQRESFKNGFNSLKSEYDWIAIFDVDEWIVPINLDEYNLKKMLSELKDNMIYLPMYNFRPPFDYDKSINEQDFHRWSTEERFENGHGTCGKSIIRGKIFLDRLVNINIHTGPEGIEEYHNNVDFESKNHKFRLHQFQNHMNHGGKPYEIYDDSIKKMFKKV